jgi:hypothetical protein
MYQIEGGRSYRIWSNNIQRIEILVVIVGGGGGLYALMREFVETSWPIH